MKTEEIEKIKQKNDLDDNFFNKKDCYSHYTTGFEALDKVTGGGFRIGITCIGAISGFGKTSFIQQIAHNMVNNGYMGISFMMEMTRQDLAIKEVSRQTALKYGPEHGISVYEIEQYINEKKLDNENAIKIARQNAYQDAREYSIVDNCYKNDKGKTIRTADDICSFVKEYVKIQKEALKQEIHPFIIIDYLQLIASPVSSWSDKQVIDDAVEKFKTLADDLKIPIIIISSFNRDSYDLAVSLKSFKESGIIEYTSELLLALQYKGVGEKGFDSKRVMQEAAHSGAAELELCILKQRYGNKDVKINYNFWGKTSYFVELPMEKQSDVYFLNNKVINNKIF